MPSCSVLASGIGTITVSLQYGIVGAYKHLWPRKGYVAQQNITSKKKQRQ